MHPPHTQKPAADKAHGLCDVDQLGGTIDVEATFQNSSVQDGIAVHRHGRLIGFIVDCRDGCHAIASNGRVLGKFNTKASAARALLFAHHQCDGGSP